MRKEDTQRSENASCFTLYAAGRERPGLLSWTLEEMLESDGMEKAESCRW